MLITDQPAGNLNDGQGPWYRGLSRYQWFVLVVAALGWLFDTMDQQLFNLARVPAMRELLVRPGVEVAGSRPSAIKPGEPFTITLTVKNLGTQGTEPLKDVKIIQYLGAGVTIAKEPVEASGDPAPVADDPAPKAEEAAPKVDAAPAAVSGRGSVSWTIPQLGTDVVTLTVSLVSATLADPAQAVTKVQAAPDQPTVAAYGGYSTSIFLLGWATGGLAFGVLGDRIGRAKTMLLTILVYSLCTGLSALSIGFWDFAIYRFLTGLGVGGEFAVGVALVAEVMPDRSRPYALGLLQALSAVGNVTAALVSMGVGHLEESGAIGSAWRWMFIIGTLPALLAIVIRRSLKEPERWQSLANKEEGVVKQLGSYRELLSNPRWRHHALVGMVLAFSGVVGLWGIGFFSFDLIRPVFEKHFKEQGMAQAEIAGAVTFWVAVQSIMQNVGGFFGIYAFAYVSQILGRRSTFAIAFVAAMLSTALVFRYLNDFYQIFWMIPLMGFCQLSLFGGYAIYFPELFPTHLRSTGTSFCYNVGRFAAAVGPFTFGYLAGVAFKGYDEPMRWAGLSMCGIFILGLLVLPFIPETRGKPLPE